MYLSLIKACSLGSSRSIAASIWFLLKFRLSCLVSSNILKSTILLRFPIICLLSNCCVVFHLAKFGFPLYSATVLFLQPVFRLLEQFPDNNISDQFYPSDHRLYFFIKTRYNGLGITIQS